jgi:murein DD-endopeptidase MepM/ murein hydrolase activator NlpD
MNTKLKYIISIILIVCMLGAMIFSMIMPFIAYADQKTDIQNKINSAGDKKGDLQGKIDSARSEKQNVLEEKNEIEGKIEVVQKEIDGLNTEISDCEKKISEKQIELDEAQVKADKQYESMKIRLRTMYEDNSTSYIELITEGESLSEMITNYELIKQLLDHDNTMYDRLVETKNKIEETKKEIENEKSVLEDKKASANAKKAELDGYNSKLAGTVSKLENDIEAYKKAYAAAEAEEKRLKDQLRSLLQGSSGGSYSGGRLEWPTPGYTTITSPFGNRVHPTLKVYKLHTGIDIAAPMGASVIAAEAGTVVISGWNNAYGNYIVINHGGGVSTLYAHNTKLFVSSGQSVTRGQKIATVGSTGFSTGPHCHFEVMVNGSVTDPIAYLK